MRRSTLNLFSFMNVWLCIVCVLMLALNSIEASYFMSELDRQNDQLEECNKELDKISAQLDEYNKHMALVNKANSRPIICVGINSLIGYDNACMDTIDPVTAGLINKPKKETVTYSYKGRFRITYYCSCAKCCGKWAGLHKTKLGTTPKAKHTIGVDPKVIPLGTKLMIQGVEYVAEDTGSFTGNKVDIYCDKHSDCYKLAKQSGDYADIYIMEDKK